MRTNLAVSDLGDLLEQPLLAVLATFRKDGSVLLSPVWHEWRDGGFQIWTGAKDAKANHLRRDPRATIVVAEQDGVLRGIEVRGTAELIGDEQGAATEAGLRIATRYLGDEGAQYVESSAGTALLVRLAPGHIRAWDFADEYAD